jgi:uncharacterized protein YukE
MDVGILQAKVMQMRDAASAIRNSAARVNDSIEAVDLEIKAIGSDRYMSDGAEEFRREYLRLTQDLKLAYEHLMRFHDKLNSSADEIEMASRPTS